MTDFEEKKMTFRNKQDGRTLITFPRPGGGINYCGTGEGAFDPASGACLGGVIIGWCETMELDPSVWEEIESD